MFDFAKRIKAAKQERAELMLEAERTMSTAYEANKPLTDDEKRRDDEIGARVDALDDEIRRLERVKREDRKVALATDVEVDRELAALRGDPRGGFRSLGEFARSVMRAFAPGGAVDPRLAQMQAAPTGYMQESGGTAGEGYLVPPQFRQEIYEVVFDDEGLLATLAPEPTVSNAVSYIKDESTPWGASGVQAYWRGEAQQMTASKAAQQAGLIQLHELYAFVLASDELLEDAPRLGDRLTRKAGAAIRWKAEEACMNGNGLAKPLGWMVSAALVSVAKESGQAADTVNGTNIAKMYSRLLGSGYARSMWLINSDVLPALLNITVGQQPVFVPPASGFTQAPGGFLFGRPVRPSEHCATVGDLGDIQFIDPAGYLAANKTGGVTFASSIHLYFDYGLQAFRWTFRLGGQPALSAPVSPAKGSATKSHFVALAERA